MVSLLLGIFLSFLAHAQDLSPKLDPNKLTVCTITINSDDEKKVWQGQVAKEPNKFNPVVELTELGSTEDWFAKSCASGIRCDQLIISGHFAGSFFSEKGDKNLSLSKLEEAGCSKTCEGILSNPYEVFLLGCNTLSGKEADHRTPAEYLQVLLRDGIPVSQAELVVQSRYGSVGDSNKAAMQRAFGGDSKLIYGFDSVGPSGKTIKPFLDKYFSRIKLSEHLEKLSAKRMMNQVEEGNKILQDVMKSTAFAHCNNIDEDDEKTKAICSLLDLKVSDDEKLAKSLELLIRDDFLVYLPHVGRYVGSLKGKELTDSQKSSLQLIKNNEVIKNQIVGLAEKASSLGLKAEWLELATNLDYLSKEDALIKIKEPLRDYFKKNITVESLEAVCSLSNKALFASVPLTSADVSLKSFRPMDIYALDCLGTPSADLTERVILAYPTGDEEADATLYQLAIKGLNADSNIPNWVLKEFKFKETLASNSYSITSSLKVYEKLFPEDPTAIDLAIKRLAMPDVYEYDIMIATFLRFEVMTPEVREGVLKIYNGPDSSQCGRCLEYLQRDPSFETQ